MKPEEIKKEAKKYFMPILAIKVSKENLQIIKSMMEAQAIVSFEAGYQACQEHYANVTDDEMLLYKYPCKECKFERIDVDNSHSCKKLAICFPYIRWDTAESQLAKVLPIFKAKEAGLLGRIEGLEQSFKIKFVEDVAKTYNTLKESND
jgi:hypothetical protein